MFAVEKADDSGSALAADIADIYLARLEGLFDRTSLGLHDGLPRPGSFLARLAEPQFWSCALCRKDLLRYSPAARFYLGNLFPADSGMPFREYLRIWMHSFFATRHDTASARDMLLLFLHQNLDYLKRMYILEQAHNQDLAPAAEALQRCFDTPSNAALFTGGGFARWVLDDWLPFHLRVLCPRERLGQQGGMQEAECTCSGEAAASCTLQ